MTTPSTARKAGPFTGNGSQNSWAFTFKVFAASDVKVTVADAAGTETVLVLGTDYSVTLNSNQDTSPGGSVTYLLANGGKLTVTGALDYDQPLDIPAGGNFNPVAFENQLDRMVMQIQQLDEQAVRALQVPVTSAMTADELVAELASGAASATAAAAAASGSASAAATSATNAAASASAAQNYVGNIIQNPILGDDVFSGNGSTTAFTLSRNMSTGNETALLVTISGVTQAPTAAYSVSGTTLTFTSAPPSGTSNIRVRYIGAMAVDAGLASAAATSAATSATAASTQATNAGNSATAAAASATTAATQATNASNSATAAAGSASTATTQATNAANSAAAAAGSVSSVATSATNAANSATAAAGSATTASTQATNAANSATAAATSATTASTHASNAANSATNAGSFATTASTHATNAGNSATAAAGSATSAANSATAASTSSNSASTSYSLAAIQATNASNSATAAAGSATAAATSAANASTSATNAASSATAAQGYLAPATSTSTSSVTIGTGSKSFTVETGKPWVPGMPLNIAVTASPSVNFMTATVTSYNSGTGALVVDVTAVAGSGTYSAWSLSLKGASGGSSARSLAMPIAYLSGRYYLQNGALSSSSWSPGGWPGIYYYPIFVESAITVDRLAATVSSSGTASFELAIYDTVNGKPSSRLGTSGTIAASTTGTKTATVSVALAPGVYWLAFGFSTGTFSMDGVYGLLSLVSGGDASFFGTFASLYYSNNGGASMLPLPASATTYTLNPGGGNNQTDPRVHFRVQ